MKKIFKIIFLSLFFSTTINAQTVTAIQQQNARATGYSIVAARNPGKSFSINLIKWDGVHDLEYNANNQINANWHAQAAIKGNFFNQTFDGTDFTSYSSVVVSQAEFDLYKSTGSDWWIVCSSLPTFSHSTVSISDAGSFGLGTSTPSYKLDVVGSVGLGSQSVNANTTKLFLKNPLGKTWAISSGANAVTESSFSIYNWTDNQTSPFFHIAVNGNIGIGTISPDEKLTVKGKIHTQEVRVDMAGPLVPDYVFGNDYKLKSLLEVEEFIKENKHLPEIPSAREIEKNGLMLAEMNMNLLKKIEELTLYSIEQNKKIESQATEIESLKDLVRRVSKIENQINQK